MALEKVEKLTPLCEVTCHNGHDLAPNAQLLITSEGIYVES